MLSRNYSKQSNTNEYYTERQIKSVLQTCSVQIGGEIDSHYLIYCPFHYNVNTPACEIDKQSGLYICFSCGENGKLLDLVMRTTSRNYFEATRTIKSAATVQDIETVIQDTLAKTDEIKEFDSELINRLHSTLMSTDEGRNYFKSRSINEQSMSEFKLGYSAKQSMVIVPVQDQYGMYVGFVGRSTEGKSFKNSVGLPKKQILFNLNRVKFKNITVVESSFDCIRLWQLGIPAVATLGAIPSKIQIELLSKYATSIIICPDKDEAGAKMVSRIKDSIVKKTVNVINVGDAKDVGDLTDEQIKELWNVPSINTFIAL